MVSVVMPVYNAMPYLEECLQSICDQLYTDWELIAVDDFSTDNSREVLNRFVNADSRITVLQNNKKGIIPALQLAYQRTNGTLITRMDADDIMPEAKLGRMKSELEHHHADCVVGYVQYFSEDLLQEGYIKYQNWLNSLIDSGSHFSDIYKECVIPSPCWMMRMDTFERIGGFSNDLYPEDYDLAFRIYENQLKIQGIKEVMHLWRDHGSRASRNDENYQDQRFYDLKLHYFLKLDYDSTKPLILWGAGKSAKTVARLLQKLNVDFGWISNNEKKIGKDIYGVRIESETTLLQNDACQVISVIKEPNYLKKVGVLYQEALKKDIDFYFFH